MGGTRRVRVIYHTEPEGTWAESPDVPGYLATVRDLNTLRRSVAEGIALFLAVPIGDIEIVEESLAPLADSA